MSQILVSLPLPRTWSAVWLSGWVWMGLAVGPVRADAPAPEPLPAPQVLSLEAAIRWALVNNPELAAFREQHGVAAAAVIIAQTYPFNPIWEAKIRGTTGPQAAGITNPVSNEHKVLLELEIHHQGAYRRKEAHAALTRTDWEIATHELTLAVRVTRAFNAYVYRQEKLRLFEEIVRLNEDASQQVRKLADQARLRPADLILARTEVDDARGQLGSGRTASLTALFELRRALGAVDECLELQGTLETPVPPLDCATLTQTALEMRPEMHARQLAIEEAEARLQLTIANRCGNPMIGPDYEVDAARVNNIGVQLVLPIPVFNRHQGEIQQRQAERARASLELRQTEVQIQQDVQAALARLDSARAWVSTFHEQILPNLRSGLAGIERLFLQGDPGVDIIRVLDVRRKLLKSRSDHLDALWEVSQAQADLVAAVGDPALILGPCQPGIEVAPPLPSNP